jgi:hypothetical protein
LCQTAQSNNSTALFVPEDKPLNLKSRKVIIQDNYGTNEDHRSWHLDDGYNFVPEPQDSRVHSQTRDVVKGEIETPSVIPFISLHKEKQQLTKPPTSLPKGKSEGSKSPILSTPFAATQSTHQIPINSTSEEAKRSPKTVENRLNIQGNTK